MSATWLAVLVFGGLMVMTTAVWWLALATEQAATARQQRLLAHLLALELTCGGEFPQVRATVQQVRSVVLGSPGDVASFRAGLRARYGQEGGPDG